MADNRIAGRSLVFQAAFLIAFVKAAWRMERGRIRYVWFSGIPNVYVNELARLSQHATEDDERNSEAALSVCRAASAERNRRFPLRVGQPASTAVKWN